MPNCFLFTTECVTIVTGIWKHDTGRLSIAVEAKLFHSRLHRQISIVEWLLWRLIWWCLHLAYSRRVNIWQFCINGALCSLLFGLTDADIIARACIQILRQSLYASPIWSKLFDYSIDRFPPTLANYRRFTVHDEAFTGKFHWLLIIYSISV